MDVCFNVYKLQMLLRDGHFNQVMDISISAQCLSISVYKVCSSKCWRTMLFCTNVHSCKKYYWTTFLPKYTLRIIVYPGIPPQHKLYNLVSFILRLDFWVHIVYCSVLSPGCQRLIRDSPGFPSQIKHIAYTSTVLYCPVSTLLYLCKKKKKNSGWFCMSLPRSQICRSHVLYIPVSLPLTVTGTVSILGVGGRK